MKATVHLCPVQGILPPDDQFLDESPHHHETNTTDHFCPFLTTLATHGFEPGSHRWQRCILEDHCDIHPDTVSELRLLAVGGSVARPVSEAHDHTS